MFSKDWKETLHGALEPGELVYIEYHASRLPNRDTRYGQRAWNIFAEVQYSVGGKVHSAIMKGPDKDGNMKTVLEIPVDAKDFIIWFKHHGYYNGYSYDSNFGENYRFSFTQIVFTGDWREYVVGSLRPGEKFQVVYDSIRLPWRDIGYLGRLYWRPNIRPTFLLYINFPQPNLSFDSRHGIRMEYLCTCAVLRQRARDSADVTRRKSGG